MKSFAFVALGATVVLGISTVLLAFPMSGSAVTTFTLSVVQSERDIDQDGVPNSADSCPIDVDGLDSDVDGLNDVCDPFPLIFNGDEDGDGVANGSDNCPLVANPGQLDTEALPQADGGPAPDGVGDDCEADLAHVTQNGHLVLIALDPAVANGRYLRTTTYVATCVGGVDLDLDGYCATEDSADSGACAATVPPSCFVRHNPWLGAGHPLLVDDVDGDTVAPIVGPISYWSDAAETYLGTDPTKPCAQDSTANNEGPLDNWPLDMDDNHLVNGGDYLKFNIVLAGGNRAVNMGGLLDGTAVSPATIAVPGMGIVSQTRFDLNFDGFLSGADLGKFNAYFNKACGAAGAPPFPLALAFQQ